MSSEKFHTNMQTMFTGIYDNGEILNDLKKIRLLFQIFQNPIMTQIKASLKVSYNLYQFNTVTYKFIANGMVAYSTILGYPPPPRGVGDVNALGERAPERGVKVSDGAIFTGFYPNWSKLSDV